MDSGIPNNPSSVWPPPPTSQPPAIAFPFRTQFLYVQGSVPNFRLGTVQLSASGFAIQGKATLPYELQIPILIVCWLVGLLVRFVLLIAYLILEYGIRRDESLEVSWQNVRQVVTNRRKSMVCLVYDAPNYKGVVKIFSLAFKLEPSQYDAFIQAAQQSVPDRVLDGKMRRWTSPRLWIVVVGLVLNIIVISLIGIASTISH